MSRRLQSRIGALTHVTRAGRNERRDHGRLEQSRLNWRLVVMLRSARRLWLGLMFRSFTVGLVLLGALVTASPASAMTGGFNNPGNILIADQFNNRVIEIDRHHHIVWQWGVGPNDLGPTSIIGVNDAQRVGDLTLMAGTGIPPNTVPNCTNPKGCPDNRVLLVNRAGKIVWQYGHFGPGGSGPGQLDTPVQNTYLPNGHILITDQANERVIEVNRAKEIVWQFGHTGVTGMG